MTANIEQVIAERDAALAVMKRLAKEHDDD